MHLNIRRHTARQKPGFLREDALEHRRFGKKPGFWAHERKSYIL